MGVAMNMGGYEIERDSVGNEYGEEVMYSGWNPEIALVCQQQASPNQQVGSSTVPQSDQGMRCKAKSGEEAQFTRRYPKNFWPGAR